MAKGKKILLVEDNEINAKLINDFLVFKGYEVTVVHSGYEALPIAEKEKPNLILMDIQLFGISGVEAAAEIKEHKELKKIPIFAISAFSMDKLTQDGQDKYFEEFIEKPIVFDKFNDLIEKYIT